MTFEEFFKKKKINLDLLLTGEPALFDEFKRHYEQMGEKSFDHTKKYWFNQLRHKYPAPVEAKTEKVHLENPIAEQTITDTLSEMAVPAPPVGFKPRFKESITTKPTEDNQVEPKAPSEEPTIDALKPAGFKPRFNAAKMAKPVTDEKLVENESIQEVPAEQPAEEAPKPVGFKPRFNAAKMAKPASDEKPVEAEPIQEAPSEQPEEAPKPVGFKPRFNAAKMKPKE